MGWTFLEDAELASRTRFAIHQQQSPAVMRRAVCVVIRQRRLRLPRAADVVDAELIRVARPERRGAESTVSATFTSWVGTPELMVDWRNSRRWHSPTVVRLQIGDGGNDQGDWFSK